MYESIHHPLVSRRVFLGRLARHMAAALTIMGGSLALGVLGYHVLEKLPWIDALLNASMIMGGMGPVDTLHTAGGKLFASAYALYSGLVLLGAAGLLFTPVLHRLLHKFHVPAENTKQ
jgi:hypothetical protein